MPKKMTPEELRDFILTKRVQALREFGYPQVNRDNIITDAVYSRFSTKRHYRGTATGRPFNQISVTKFVNRN